MPHSIDDPSLIFRTPNGKVLRCTCCGRLEVVFGNIALAEDPPLFERLRQIVASLDVDVQTSRIDSERPILLSVDGEKLAFRFTREEAIELQELLNGAAAMLELGEMLDDTLRSDAGNEL